MWKPWVWAVGSNERAIGNAREAATACSRRRVEHADVELFLAGLLDPAAGRRGPGPGTVAAGDH